MGLSTDVQDWIDTAQYRILQAMNDLEEAFKLAETYGNDVLHGKIKTEWQALSSVDDRLGDIKSGRNV